MEAACALSDEHVKHEVALAELQTAVEVATRDAQSAQREAKAARGAVEAAESAALSARSSLESGPNPNPALQPDPDNPNPNPDPNPDPALTRTLARSQTLALSAGQAWTQSCIARRAAGRS